MSSLLEELARAIEQAEKDKAEAIDIAERMRDYWKNLRSEAEDWRG